MTKYIFKSSIISLRKTTLKMNQTKGK